jgi:hypothetical protein
MIGHVLITDALPSKLERQRHELIVRRAILRAQYTADPDPELRAQIERIDRKLAALDDKRQRRRP